MPEVRRLHLHDRVELVVVPGHVDLAVRADRLLAADARDRALLAQLLRGVVARNRAAPGVAAVRGAHQDYLLGRDDRARVEAPADVDRPDLVIVRLVGTAVRIGVVVDCNPVLVVQQQLLGERVPLVVVDDDRAGPALVRPLDVHRHVEAGERQRAARGVEGVRVGVALVVER